MKMKIEEIEESKQKEIWDLDYLTTSDEEDNDTEEEVLPSDSDDDTQQN